MILERILLQTIKFDLQVNHPYSSLIKYAKCLKGDGIKLERMVQNAWTFVNDSLSTTLCLQWEPEVVAIAVIYLTAKMSKFEVKDWTNRKSWHKRWWDQYVEDLDIDVLDDICHQVLDLYDQTDGPPPTKDQMESPPPVLRSKPSSGTSSRKSTPPLPRDPQLPPLPPQSKSRPHTPPPPMPSGSGVAPRPSGTTGGPAFQYHQPIPPSGSSSSKSASSRIPGPPFQDNYGQNFPPLPSSGSSSGSQRYPPQPGSYGYPGGSRSQQPSGSKPPSHYYNRPPLPQQGGDSGTRGSRY